eukprot:CAMPEP_0198542900 /NCGR_PEP_ID=MMETSP1462-20131121/59093_1 /TAXON_ID=1333877 /ORGANISM="Brandtodinium nutriculum, Strain RCC3387" /LENGTH=91 /DNA_ID=CAMNT_0044273157 /DNA_START=6 /DNA_END=277 /DNA_ORIENTATION=+
MASAISRAAARAARNALASSVASASFPAPCVGRPSTPVQPPWRDHTAAPGATRVDAISAEVAMLGAAGEAAKASSAEVAMALGAPGVRPKT